jgi:predicted DNA binding protein
MNDRSGGDPPVRSDHKPGGETPRIDAAVDVCVSTDACDTLVRLEVSTESGCVLSSVDGTMDVIQHTFRTDKCEVVLRRETGDGQEILKGGTIDVAACPLLVMDDYGVTASVVDVTDDGFVVDGYAPDDEVVWPLLEELRTVTKAVTIRKIVGTDQIHASSAPCQVDLDALTEKQREALDLAYTEGYFERPRRTTQAELADELGISKQAVSRRLTRVEENLFGQLLG